ncbi:hypothetical protein FNH22_29855 [Fulvivirga sp. M361]|uniref:hypothetical protein n=1 Tax=Fulvivirga sp. M361 TaxID=2594266 RepID=UPI001179E22E|nr:hypothetical protein [Fulvivirga sp. M361]TRX48071.1 hypothetical protein FNH22_29855 [Fulvivirga sp. M361]
MSIIFSSCHDSDLPDKNNDFVPGDVIVGIKADISIDQVFELMNEEHVTIDRMSGFFNYSTLPNDSLTYVTNFLKNKPYLNKRGLTGGSAYVHKLDNVIIITEFFFEMDIAAQQDWMKTMQTLELKDLNGDTKNLLIKVDHGMEEHWANKFNDHPYVEWTHLNAYAEIELL